MNMLIIPHVSSKEIFNFNVTEIEILQNGNIFKGYNGGEASTDDGISITANNFEYNKIATTLIARKNVNLKDKSKNLFIIADEIFYIRNIEKIIASGNVQIKDEINNLIINADKIFYFKNEDKIIASGNVSLNDLTKNIILETKKITYQKNLNKIFTEGKTYAYVKSKYKIYSKNVTYLLDKMSLYSSQKTTVRDNKFAIYSLDNFNYQINDEFLKGKNVLIVENTHLPIEKRNQLNFESGFFDLKNNSFKTTGTKIKLQKDLFDKSENDPRLYGASSLKKKNITSVKKAVFTSCKKTDHCPAWQLEASEIKHDQKNKKIIYDNAVLKVYDVPVFYFPKFFHPDPTVKRQSGFLQPEINSSNILGSSLSIPYYHVISEDKDFTFNPIFFTKNAKMIQSEYRQKNENSSLIADFAITNGYKSTSTQKKKNINHFFSNFKKDLKINNFFTSDLSLFVERISKDTYLKIFGDNLSNSSVKPLNSDVMNSGFDLLLENETFFLSGGANIYEDLTKLQSDRYQYVLPYYNFSLNSIPTDNGTINFSSSGNNTLDNTNNVKSRVINNVSYSFNEKIFENVGLTNNLSFYFKNLNSVGKNVTQYKSSPQVEIQSLLELNSQLPLLKKTMLNNQTLVPRLSLRFNPSDMINHSDTERKININNIFDINRLGLEDSFESGNSLTLGIDYKKENIKDEDKSLEIKFASVFRDSEEKNVPSQTTLNKKNSNLFGSINYQFSKFLDIDYDFAIDNKINNFEYNSIELGLSLNNFITKFNFIEEDLELGNTNIFENTTSYNFDDSNSIKFRTRRNREINLTEYYNLVYEYKNDCLTAGIRFNKTYYEDRDLKPSENLMFTISFFPITSIEQSFK
ncbi:LPS-assembly protein LptD [Candidatus Pelagibacter bacterium nBUS_30]|uniref:LPS-assembly protein LptD n=1 Tax=Candidatus Pelagibacter bacterium nBUS_30 TaxID=3374191 RepID=UPI003EBDB915